MRLAKDRSHVPYIAKCVILLIALAAGCQAETQDPAAESGDPPDPSAAMTSKPEGGRQKSEPPKKPALIQRYRRWLRTGDANERTIAASQLGKIGPDAKSAVPDLTRVLDDEDSRVRRLSLGALVRIDPTYTRLRAAFAKALRDEDFDVRMAAIRASKLIGEAAIPTFVEGMQNDNEIVRLRAVEMLGQIGTASVPPLIDALEHEDGGVRRLAVVALRSMGPAAKDAIPALKRLLENERVHRSFVETALQKIDAAEESPDER